MQVQGRLNKRLSGRVEAGLVTCKLAMKPDLVTQILLRVMMVSM